MKRTNNSSSSNLFPSRDVPICLACIPTTVPLTLLYCKCIDGLCATPPSFKTSHKRRTWSLLGPGCRRTSTSQPNWDRALMSFWRMLWLELPRGIATWAFPMDIHRWSAASMSSRRPFFLRNPASKCSRSSSCCPRLFDGGLDSTTRFSMPWKFGNAGRPTKCTPKAGTSSAKSSVCSTRLLRCL